MTVVFDRPAAKRSVRTVDTSSKTINWIEDLIGDEGRRSHSETNWHTTDADTPRSEPVHRIGYKTDGNGNILSSTKRRQLSRLRRG